MATVFSDGCRVEALNHVLEEGFKGPEEIWTHAAIGDRGAVVLVDGDWVTVTWERTGTTSDCHRDELALVTS